MKLDFTIIVFNIIPIDTSKWDFFKTDVFKNYIHSLYFNKNFFNFQDNETYYVHLFNMHDQLISVVPFTMYKSLEDEYKIYSNFDLLDNDIINYSNNNKYIGNFIMYINKDILLEKKGISNKLNILYILFIKYIDLKNS